MVRRSFSAIGTQWQILADTDVVSEQVWKEISNTAGAFEKRFSRFLPDSEVSQWRDASPGTYPLSPELARLLRTAQQLKHDTKGLFDPVVGGFLEELGYDSSYRFTESSNVQSWRLPQWEVQGRQLTIDGSVLFDLGGFAKGTLIDMFCSILDRFDIQSYIVDGGGDLRGTRKHSGEPWNVAVEWPGKPNLALCSVPLQHKALAASDIFKRRWGEWHHLIHPGQKISYSQVVGCAVVADSAELADGLTTCFALLPEQERAPLAEKYQAEFVLVTQDQRVQTSAGWPGSFFS